jgi:hypothetical protein
MSEPYVPNLTCPAPANLAESIQFTGPDVPSADLGTDGDEYIRTNGDVYTKGDGAWTQVAP